MAYGDTVFNLTDVRVARLNSDGTYGASYSLDVGVEFSFENKGDTDMLKGYGMVTSLLSVPTHVEGTVKQGALDFEALAAMTGLAIASSGTTPNLTETIDYLVGDSGLPYFGAVGAFASEFGGNVLVGLMKCQLDTYPGWMVEQNKFRIGETKFKAITNSTSTRKLLRMRRYETAVSVPSDLSTFFA